MKKLLNQSYNPRWIRIRIFITVSILLIPLWSFILWYLKSSKPINIMIVDKTVPFLERNEHRSFNWILTLHKYVKPDKKLYSVNKDYIGFFPLKPIKDKKFEIKDIEKYSDSQIDSIGNSLDMIYFTDTYGVYSNEWYSNKNTTEHSDYIYGGLTNQEFKLMENLKNRKKLILAEFNFFHSPTSYSVRKKTEKLFDLKWTNWTGRYFELLDSDRTKNPELPRWIVNLYLQQHNNKWPFTKPGIVLHNDDDRLEVLEYETHTKIATPYIFPFEYAKKKYNLPDSIHFSYWFDITYPGFENKNRVIAYYKIFTNSKGDSILKKNNLTNVFPCIIEHLKPNDYSFYYFAGDMADNPMHNLSCYFRGIQYLDFMFYTNEPSKRTKYFYQFYFPLVKTILEDYNNKLKEERKLITVNR